MTIPLRQVIRAIEEVNEVFTSFWDKKTGKTIIPFATSGGSDIGKTNERLAPSCKGAKLMDGKVFKGSVGHQELAAWVEELGL